MSHRVLVFMGVLAAIATMLVTGVAPVTAQTTVPRTPWGQPDLQGIWDFRTITPMERPEDLADQAFLTEEEAAGFEQEAIDRNIRLAVRAAERTEVAEQVDSRDDGSRRSG